MPSNSTSRLKASNRDDAATRAAWKEQAAIEEYGRVTTHVYLRRDSRQGVYGIRIASWYHEENTAPRKVVTTEVPWPNETNQPLSDALLSAIMAHGTQIQGWRAQYEMGGEAP